MTLIPQHFFCTRARGRHFRVVRKHKTSDMRSHTAFLAVPALAR
jgi:hypothetical protein